MTDPAFLLDSNICIYVLDGHPDGLRHRLQACAPGTLVTSSIVYAEIMRGIDPANRMLTDRAERLFTLFPVQDFDRAAALRYRSLPFRRASFDRLIAAHTLSLGLTLVTNNAEDFADVPGLKIENWAA